MSSTTLFLWATVLFPLAGSLLLALVPGLNEKIMARVALTTTFLSSTTAFAAFGFWAAHGFKPLTTPEISVVTSGAYHFELGLSLDVIAAAFLFLVQFTSGMVIRFSRVYMHREPGFRRFFAVVLMFQAGMALLTLASNLDLMFCGWEMVGLASFLLIAFYYERQSPVRNALKTFSIYRVADVGMLLGAFLQHHSPGTAVGLLLLLAAAGKSAQFPFSFWIVRAMEGPTPSSALFYGALSVNAGAFLLLRTYPIWGGITAVHICVGALGLLTAVLCTMFSRAQHTIKGQVGYASAAQVGFIFLELALGLKSLALFHMVSNALLRCYQLLVSPSAVAYLLRQQSSSEAAKPSEEHSLFQRLLTREARSSLYVFAISEGYLEDGIRTLFWAPLRWIALKTTRVHRPILAAIGVLAVAGTALVSASHTSGRTMIGVALLMAAALCSVVAIGYFGRPLKSLAWLAGSSTAAALAVFVGSSVASGYPGLEYSLAVAVMCALAFSGFGAVTSLNKEIPRQAGLITDHPYAAWAAILGALGIAGFPLLPTFFGEDIMLHEAFQIHPMFAFGLSCLFALNGYVAVRTFALTFFGRSTRQPSMYTTREAAQALPYESRAQER